jgi:hypothetical protein
MGIFFNPSPAFTESRTTLKTEEGLPEQKVSEVVGEEPSKLLWGRLIFAVIVLVAIFFAGIYTAGDEKLADWSKLLLHSFELLLGAFIGILTSEAASKK